MSALYVLPEPRLDPPDDPTCVGRAAVTCPHCDEDFGAEIWVAGKLHWLTCLICEREFAVSEGS